MNWGVSTKGINIRINDASIHAKRFRITESKLRAHHKALSNSPAKYPLTVSRVFTANIASKSRNAICDNLITGLLPNRLFVAFVSKDDYIGLGCNSNPFKFTPANVEQIVCYIDGVQLPWANTHNTDFESGLCVAAYNRLFDVLNQSDSDPVCNITLDEFKNDCCIFAFHLAADHSDGYGAGRHWNSNKRGNLRIDIRFSEENASDNVLIAFAEFNKLYQIDSYRNLSKVPM